MFAYNRFPWEVASLFHDRIRRDVSGNPGLTFRLVLLAGVLAAPALGQITCIALPNPWGAGPGGAGAFVLQPPTKINVYSGGFFVNTFTIFPPNSFTGDRKFSIYDGTVPWVTAANPTGEYDATSAEDAVNQICPNGVEPAGTRPPTSARQRAASQLSAPAPSGSAAGPFAYGDFNGDGILDVASSHSGDVTVDLYQSGGNVLSSTTYTVSSSTTADIIAADFNGDGILDLAVIVATDLGVPGSVAILLGKRDGTFGSPANFPAGPNPLYFAAGDFNGDGKLDLAVASQGVFLTGGNATPGSVAILLGKGDGTFSAPVNYNVGNFLDSIVATDLNGDGNADLAVLDTQGATEGVLWVLLGNGDGTFRSPGASTPTGTGFQGSLAYADLNHDGKEDILAVSQPYSLLSVLLGNGDGTFQPFQSYITAAQPSDVGVVPLQDGNTALFTGDAITDKVLLIFAASDGSVSTPPVQIVGPGASSAVVTADLNGDGKPDIVLSETIPVFPGVGPTASGAVYVLLNLGNGQFATPVPYLNGSSPVATVVADVNNDGKPDLIAEDATGIDVLLGKGDGTFSAPQASAVSSGQPGLAVADFNSDGKLDVAFLTASGVSILPGNGNGTFGAATNLPPPNSNSNFMPSAIVAGDFNGDGKPDLAVGYSNPNDLLQASSIVLLLGKGGGTFQSPVNISVPAGVVTLSAGDINNDGKLDLIANIISANSEQLAVLLGKGDGTFQAPALINTATSGTSVVIADLNGDGNPDLVLGDQVEATFMLGNGDGTFQTETQFPSGPNPGYIAVADLLGDGKPDFVIAGKTANLGPGTLVLVPNFFGTTSSSTATIVSAANPAAVGVAPGSLATAYGTDLASSVAGGTSLPLPTSFGGTSLSIVDSSGSTKPAPLLYVSPTQVNFEVPPGVASGAAQATIISGDGTQSVANVQIAPVAPGLFELNSNGLAAADVILYHADGTQTVEQVYTVNAGTVVANPVSLGSSTDQPYLVLFGTGLEAAGTAGVTVSVGGTAVPVRYVGSQGGYVGLDQVNVVLPQSLAGKGSVTIQLTANGLAANPVNIAIQ
jgi:uncharacterized protein (TIGR03437 family)